MWFLIIFVIVVILAFIILIIVLIRKNEKDKFPHLTIRVDITNKRITSANDALDYFLTNYGKELILNHLKKIETWKKEELEKCKGKIKKINKFNDNFIINSNKAFRFIFARKVTRYKQINYVKSSYSATVISFDFSCSGSLLLNRINFLEKNGYYVTFNEFHKDDQRKALNKKLRDFIKERDNFTCQCCGKYMPDEVGLHIDHIIPISKGGKSTPNNLRVLCSKCNSKKSNKTESKIINIKCPYCKTTFTITEDSKKFTCPNCKKILKRSN